MKSDPRHNRLREIFDEARGMPDETRTAYVDKACGGDDALRSEVEGLLSNLDSMGSFLEGGALEGAAVDVPSESASGKVFGDFRLIREIGRGGMGVVYLAEQISLGRRVAVKVLPPSFALDAERVVRFRREARTVAKLRHPGIVPVYTIGEEGDSLFFAMEYVEGRSLADAIDDLADREDREDGEPIRDRLECIDAVDHSTESADLAARVAEALHYAHEEGVIHRDVKPDNILIERDGTPRVVDFGLSKDLAREGLTSAGHARGTPAYMSPEQARGEVEGLDRRTDVFSLGCVLYEMLTLCRPFKGSSPDHLLASILSKDPIAPGKLNPDVPPALEAVCRKAMEKAPEDRYATALEMAEDLRRFLRSEPIRIGGPGAARKLGRMIRRRPRTVIAVVGVIALAVAAALWRAGGSPPAEFTVRAEFYRVGDPPDQGVTILPGGAVRFDEGVRLRIACDRSVYVYAWNESSDEAPIALVPFESEAFSIRNPIDGSGELILPPDIVTDEEDPEVGAWSFSGEPGPQSIWLVVSSTREPTIESIIAKMSKPERDESADDRLQYARELASTARGMGKIVGVASGSERDRGNWGKFVESEGGKIAWRLGFVVRE